LIHLETTCSSGKSKWEITHKAESRITIKTFFTLPSHKVWLVV